jgi:hypothetical protein
MKNDGKNGSDGKHVSHDAHTSQSPERLLPPRGDYRTLLSFQKAEIVYDITFRFAHKHLSRGDRTVDQMIQSARSGKKNILEGSKAALTSMETEIKLTNVARASLEELLDDYKDHLRARDLTIWDKDSKEAQYVRRLGRKTPQSYENYREFVETRPPEVIANIALCLIHQTNFLIDQQLRRVGKRLRRAGRFAGTHDPRPTGPSDQTFPAVMGGTPSRASAHYLAVPDFPAVAVYDNDGSAT